MGLAGALGAALGGALGAALGGALGAALGAALDAVPLNPLTWEGETDPDGGVGGFADGIAEGGADGGADGGVGGDGADGIAGAPLPDGVGEGADAPTDGLPGGEPIDVDASNSDKSRS